MPTGAAQATNRSDSLLQGLARFKRAVVVTHDNPDPDAIATGWALACLIEEKLSKPVRLLGGGAIVRAENKHMVELLQPPIELVTELDVASDTAAILVDCGFGATNHLATRSHVRPFAVVDHHLNGAGAGELPFVDIRPSVVASASIAASYLREQRVDPGAKLATAILYAIHTETSGGETQYSSLDRAIVKWLTGLADLELLADIENAPLDREYFDDLAAALQQTIVYGDAAFCFLSKASGAETVGEVADLLIRCRGVRRVLCAALVGDNLVLSARTGRDCENAAKLLQQTLVGLGGCGGHEHRAGGQIPAAKQRYSDIESLRDELRGRWLSACGVDRLCGVSLVAHRGADTSA